MPADFDRDNHVYLNSSFLELINKAVEFFNNTPEHSLPPHERFTGTGVYAIYYNGNYDLYKEYGRLNKKCFTHPIYIGKAVPEGWRQSRNSGDSVSNSRKLYGRLREHYRSILSSSSLSVRDFACRFLILEGESTDMIGTLEAALIKYHRPLWNSCVDGFGNHTPGAGRFEQAKSDWDVLHPGRTWAARCQGMPNSYESIKRNVENHFKSLSTK